MTGQHLVEGRKRKGWNQAQAALELGVSQPYLSLLEKNKRPVPAQIAHKAARVYKLSHATLPLETGGYEVKAMDNKILAADLAGLGYPPFSHLKGRGKSRNPAIVLASALKADDLESRLVEALPWILLEFPHLDWHWLITAAKVNDLQNRLGFVTNIARHSVRSLTRKNCGRHF